VGREAENLSNDQNFLDLYGAQKFIPMFTKAGCWSKTLPLHAHMTYFLNIHFSIVVPSTRKSPTLVFPSSFATKILQAFVKFLKICSETDLIKSRKSR
jgi:hypothetical protein